VTREIVHSYPLELECPRARPRSTRHSASIERSIAGTNATRRGVTHARDLWTPFVTRDDRHERDDDDDDDDDDDGQTLREGARQGDASDARERTTIGGGEREQEV